MTVTTTWSTRHDGVRAQVGIRWAHYDFAGRRMAQGSDSLTVPTADQLTAWDAEAPTIAARAGAWAGRDLYIRFGDRPAGGRSRNYATGELEAGISVYEARHDLVSDTWMTDGAMVGTLVSYLAQGLPARLVTGDEIGSGSDGEPVLADVEVVAELVRCDRGWVVRR